MTYQEKLRDPRWQKKRLEILNRDKFTCQECYNCDKELHVHHRGYLKRTEPWDYPEEMLITLCLECHKLQTSARERIEKCIASMTPESVGGLALFLEHTTSVFGDQWVWWVHWLHYAELWEKKSDEVLSAELALFQARAHQSATLRRAALESPQTDNDQAKAG